MAKTIPALLALFKIDRDIRHVQDMLDSAQRSQKLQETKLAQLTKSIDTQDAAVKKLQAEVGTKELEIKSKQEHIDKLRASLNNTKTNKDYSAILVQISADKAEVAKVETAALEQMAQVETANKQIAALRTQVESEKTTLGKILAENAARVTELQAQSGGLKAERDAAAKAVPPDALRQYQRISEKYPGDALAPLEFNENDLESITCGSCYIGLNVEHLNALRSRDEVRKCNSCGRILYLPEMLPQNMQLAH